MFSKVISFNKDAGELNITKYSAKCKKKMGDKKMVKYENINAPVPANV